jgi:hypothetical protein
MSTLTWENPCEPSISRSFGELDSNASRVTALWLDSQTCACPPCRAMRTSMGPSAGGLTCSFALVRLPSIITDTLSATPCPNPGVSTPAAILNVGAGLPSVGVFEVISCAAPALPSFEAADKDRSGLVVCERLSAAPAPAALETSCAILPAVAAVTAAEVAADVAADACAKAAGAPTGASCAAETPCSTSPPLEDDEIEGALVPCTIAAATTAGAGAAGAAVAAAPFGAPSIAVLLGVWDEAGAIAPWLRNPSPGLAPGAVPWGAAEMGVPADVAADASVRILDACGTLEPEPGTAGLLAALPGALALAAEAGATPPGAETSPAARSKLGASAAVLPALAGRVGAAGIALGFAPAAPAGGPAMAPAASATCAAAKRSVFTAGGDPKAVSAGGDAGTGGG